MSLAVARLPSRRSSAATVSLRAGRLALPVLVLGGAAHRFGWIDTPALFAVMALAFALALVAVVAAGLAFDMIWRTGADGLRKATGGALLGLLALTPAIIAVAGMVSLPRLHQVSTDTVDPPFFRRALEGRAAGMNALTVPSPADLQAERAAYPDILTRRYPLTVQQAHLAALRTVERIGWTVVDHYPPVNERDRGRIEAVARTLVFGFRDDVALRILPDPAGARLDLRSVSRYGAHDLGTNAARIRAFQALFEQVVVELNQ
jgi:uncharacterized protein (DUF1499 family)